MDYLLKSFAVIFVVVSLFSIPKLVLLSTFIEYFSERTEIEESNKMDRLEDNDPDMVEIRGMLNEWVNSTDFKIWVFLKQVSSLIIALAGIFAALKILKNKPFPYLLIISVSTAYLLSQWAPWDLSTVLTGVDSYAAFVRRIDILWKYDGNKNWIISSGVIGSFYLTTGAICTLVYLQKKIIKSNKANSHGQI